MPNTTFWRQMVQCFKPYSTHGKLRTAVEVASDVYSSYAIVYVNMDTWLQQWVKSPGNAAQLSKKLHLSRVLANTGKYSVPLQ